MSSQLDDFESFWPKIRDRGLLVEKFAYLRPMHEVICSTHVRKLTRLLQPGGAGFTDEGQYSARITAIIDFCLRDVDDVKSSSFVVPDTALRLPGPSNPDQAVEWAGNDYSLRNNLIGPDVWDNSQLVTLLRARHSKRKEAKNAAEAEKEKVQKVKRAPAASGQDRENEHLAGDLQTSRSTSVVSASATTSGSQAGKRPRIVPESSSKRNESSPSGFTVKSSGLSTKSSKEGHHKPDYSLGVRESSTNNFQKFLKILEFKYSTLSSEEALGYRYREGLYQLVFYLAILRELRPNLDDLSGIALVNDRFSRVHLLEGQNFAIEMQACPSLALGHTYDIEEFDALGIFTHDTFGASLLRSTESFVETILLSLYSALVFAMDVDPPVSSYTPTGAAQESVDLHNRSEDIATAYESGQRHGIAYNALKKNDKDRKREAKGSSHEEDEDDRDHYEDPNEGEDGKNDQPDNRDAAGPAGPSSGGGSKGGGAGGRPRSRPTGGSDGMRKHAADQIETPVDAARDTDSASSMACDDDIYPEDAITSVSTPLVQDELSSSDYLNALKRYRIQFTVVSSVVMDRITKRASDRRPDPLSASTGGENPAPNVLSRIGSLKRSVRYLHWSML